MSDVVVFDSYQEVHAGVDLEAISPTQKREIKSKWWLNPPSLIKQMSVLRHA